MRDIDIMREEQDIQLQEEAWDTDCDQSARMSQLYSEGKIKPIKEVGKEEFQVGDLVAGPLVAGPSWVLKISNLEYYGKVAKAEVVASAECENFYYTPGDVVRIDLRRCILWERSSENQQKAVNPTLIKRGAKFETQEWADNCKPKKDFEEGDLIHRGVDGCTYVIYELYEHKRNGKPFARCGYYEDTPSRCKNIDLTEQGLSLFAEHNRLRFGPETENKQANCQVSFDREMVETEYDYDILDRGRGLV